LYENRVDLRVNYFYVVLQPGLYIVGCRKDVNIKYAKSRAYDIKLTFLMCLLGR